MAYGTVKFFEPEKFVLNVIAYVTVRLLPDTEPPEPDPVSEHWLFDSDPDPGVIGPSHVFPASFINRRVLPGRLNSTKHAAVPDTLPFTRRCASAISTPPFASL